MRSDKKRTRLIRSRKLISIASALLSAIAVLGVVQWATAFRGDLLWMAIIAISLLFIGVLFLMLPGQLLTGSKLEEDKTLSKEWLDELHDNDRHIIGSAMYRGHNHDE